MNVKQSRFSRRQLLTQTACGMVGGWAATHLPRVALAQTAAAGNPSSMAPTTGNPSSVALTTGSSRGDNVLRALKQIEGQIRAGLATKKTVVLKPNMVVTNRQLAATHVDCLEAILQFLKPLVKDEIIIAETPAGSPAGEGFANYGYERLKGMYNVRFVDLDESPTIIRHVIDQRYQPVPVRFAKLLWDPQVYVVSSAVMKTHDRAVCTLSLKNVIVGAAIKDRMFRWGPEGKGSNDKMLIHGGPGNEAIHYNLFQLAPVLHPNLAVIDGFQSMEGNGPVVGTPVDHKVAIASTDWLAADRVAVELMGFDFAKVGYLSFCAKAGYGEGNLSKIEILGEKVADHRRQYRPHDNIEKQYQWMTRANG